MLTFNLKKQWYEKIRSGEKTIEYREDNPYWNERLNDMFGFYKHFHRGSDSKFPCVLRLGYTKQYMTANVVYIEWLETGKDTDLAIDAPVYAIHLADVQEVKNDN